MRPFASFLIVACAVATFACAAAAQDAYLDPAPPAEGPGYSAGKNPLDHKASVEINAGDYVSAVPKRFHYAFRLNLRGVYDDNIFISNGERVDDYYFAIEPGVTIGWGDIVGRDMNYLRLDYAPSIFLFTDNSDANAVQHLDSVGRKLSFHPAAVERESGRSFVGRDESRRHRHEWC